MVGLPCSTKAHYRAEAGKPLQLMRGIYVDAADNADELVRRHAIRIAHYLYPNAYLSAASAALLGPTSDGRLYLGGRRNQRTRLRSLEIVQEVFLHLVEAHRFPLQLEVALAVLIERLEEETLHDRQGTVSDRYRGQRAGLAPQGLTSPVHIQRLLEDVVEHCADAVMLRGQPRLQESLDVTLAARPGLDDGGRFLHQTHDVGRQIIRWAYGDLCANTTAHLARYLTYAP
jgi:hypothetical protein